MPKYPPLPRNPELEAEFDARRYEQNTAGDPWANLDEFAPEEVAMRPKHTPETIAEFNEAVKRMNSEKGMLSDENLAKIMPEEPTVFETWNDEDTQDVNRMYRQLAEKPPESYWEEYGDFTGDAAPATLEEKAIARNLGGADAAKSWGYTQRWADRGRRAGAALGKLGQRAMQIPGVEQASVIAKTVGRPLGAALGAAGPIFDAMAVKELSDQWEELKAGERHREDTRMGAAKYATILSSAEQRRKHEAANRRAEVEAKMIQQAQGNQSVIGVGESAGLIQLPDGTVVSADNLRRMQMRQANRQRRGY